jgi:hypothetical protein
LPQALVLNLQPQEVALAAAFDTFRKAIHTLIADERSTRRRTGTFAVEILGKRLLSCAVAFADSWRRCKQGLAENETARRAPKCRPPAATWRPKQAMTAKRTPASPPRPAWWVPGSKASPPHSKPKLPGSTPPLPGLRLDAATGDLAQVNPLTDSRYAALEALIERLLHDPWHMVRPRTPGRLHRVQDYPRLPCAPPDRKVRRRTKSDTLSAAWTMSSAAR